MATGLELRAWRKKNDLTQGQAAERFGKSERQWRAYEKGAADIPDDVRAGLIGEASPPVARAADALAVAQGKPPRASQPVAQVSHVASFDNPPGRPHYHPLTPPGTILYLEKDWPFPKWPASLPKGRWRMIYDEPTTYQNGAEVTSIEWRSNGVGSPSMVLYGHLNDAVALPGLEGLQRGAYHPFTPDPSRRQQTDDDSRLKGAKKGAR